MPTVMSTQCHLCNMGSLLKKGHCSKPSMIEWANFIYIKGPIERFDSTRLDSTRTLRH